jgi:hypothetical protein
MPNTLQSAISDLATSFASAIVAAIRHSNLQDILAIAAESEHAAAAPARGRRAKPAAPKAAATPKPAPKAEPASAPARPAPAAAAKPAPKAAAPTTAKKGSAGRLKRRSPQDIAKALARIVELVKKHPKGLRAEEIRAELKMESKEMPRILKEGLAKKALKSKGHKRSTTYSAA